MRVNVKPLSVNRCFQGRRFKTVHYKNYEQEVMLELKPMDVPEGNLKIAIVFGFSSSLADIDNGLKPFIDILQKKYGFNDRLIHELHVMKVKVKKGDEFIEFELTSFEEILEIIS